MTRQQDADGFRRALDGLAGDGGGDESDAGGDGGVEADPCDMDNDGYKSKACDGSDYATTRYSSQTPGQT